MLNSNLNSILIKRNYLINNKKDVKIHTKRIQTNSIFSTKNNTYRNKNIKYQCSNNRKSELQNEAYKESLSNDETNKNDNEESKSLKLNKDNQNDIIYLLSKIPIQKIGIWIFFGILVHQLKDFFGVQ